MFKILTRTVKLFTAVTDTTGQCYKTFFDEITSLSMYNQPKSKGNTSASATGVNYALKSFKILAIRRSKLTGLALAVTSIPSSPLLEEDS